MGKSTISMAMFYSKLLVYQRVNRYPHFCWLNPTLTPSIPMKPPWNGRAQGRNKKMHGTVKRQRHRFGVVNCKQQLRFVIDQRRFVSVIIYIQIYVYSDSDINN